MMFKTCIQAQINFNLPFFYAQCLIVTYPMLSKTVVIFIQCTVVHAQKTSGTVVHAQLLIVITVIIDCLSPTFAPQTPVERYRSLS